MKILQIIPSLHGGGAEKFVIDLSNELSENNEVIICSLYNLEEDMFMAKSINKNIKIINLNKKLGIDLKIFFLVLKLILKEKPDVVNTHLRALFYSILGILFSKTIFFHTVHNIAQKETNKLNQLIYSVLFKYFKVKPIAISKKVLESIKEVYHTKFNFLIENGVKRNDITIKAKKVYKEVKKYKFDENTKVFLNIGRISHQKNQEMLIKVFNELKDQNIILLIIGQDTTKDQALQTYLKEISNNNIYFLGMKDNIIDYLFYSDFFCLSSKYEGLPITLLESLSMGTIPICTPAGGIPDVLNSNVGFLSVDFSKLNFKKTIMSAMKTNENELSIMRKNSIELFNSNYKIEITGKKYIQLYKREHNV